MVRKLFAVGVVAVLLVGVGLTFASGFGPAPGEDDGTELTDFPTETPDSGSSDGSAGGGDETPDGGDGTAGDGDGSTATATPVQQPFAFSVDRIEECGQTCRDVTVSLTNRQSDPASDTTVYTRIFAGNSTDEDDLVWSGREEVGSLGAGETHTATKRVELSYSEAYAVQEADGWITVQTTVQTDDRTITFTERRNVD